MNPGPPPSAEPGRLPVPGDTIPGQLALPGMPSPAAAAAGQATLPGLEADAWDEAGDGRAAADEELAAVAAELRGLDRDGSRMAAAIRGALDGKLLLLVQASDEEGTWSAGLVRATRGG